VQYPVRGIFQDPGGLLYLLSPLSTIPGTFYATTTMPTRIGRRSTDVDPFASVVAPPENETPAQREERLLLEKEAKQISDAIDEQLNREKAQQKKGPKPVKVLLLGELNSSVSIIIYIQRRPTPQGKANQVLHTFRCDSLWAK
jgi:hypothetical protein